MVAELQEAVKRGAAFIELRLDFLAKAVDFKRLLPLKKCPWVATLRRPADGGRYTGTEQERPGRSCARRSCPARSSGSIWKRTSPMRCRGSAR